MAISELDGAIGKLGTDLAQRHYATTTDLDGPLPWLPTDADRAELVQMLERAPTLAESRVFESGYRESMHRLQGNANDVRENPVMIHEMTAMLCRYGIILPPEGSPERQNAAALISRAVVVLREQIEALVPKMPERDAA